MYYPFGQQTIEGTAMPGQRAPEEERREQILRAAYAVALREGIDCVTLRAVAAEAGLSHGLVVFYYKQKDQLIDALLDRVLATTAMLDFSADVARLPLTPGRLGAVVRQELTRLSREPRDIRLFFEYWALGVRQAAIRRKIGAALGRYRAAFEALAEETMPPEGRRASDVTPAALAAVAVSLITGCAVQAMSDPERFDTGAYLAAAQGLIERLGSAATPSSGRTRRGGRAAPSTPSP
jgi:TetR/AcrR family transcriptional repressor of bet genes